MCIRDREDLAIVRSFANLTVVTPGDPGMFRNVLLATLNHKGPVYIRMARGKDEPSVYPVSYTHLDVYKRQE